MRCLRWIAARASAFAAVLALAVAAPASAERALRAGDTSLRFEPEILRDLGVALVDVAQTGAPLRDGALGFAIQVAASRIAFAAPAGDFEAFSTADLRHAGGFALRVRGARIDLAGFRLTAAAPPHLLELRDREGRRWLVVDRAHARLTGDRLALANADLLIAPELARRIGRADLAWTYLGELDGELALTGADAAPSAALAPQGAAGACAGDFSQPVDLLMESLTSMTQAAREPGGRVAIAPAATVRNLGPGDVAWYKTIAPDNPVGPHPFLVMNFYRLANGALRQIGGSDVKHTFFATNTGCECAAGQILYAGCADLYGVSTNLNRLQLAPRSEVDATAVTWTSLGSHFDGTPADYFRDHGGDSAHDSFEHRLVVREPDLQTPGARYFYDAWYLAPNDANLLNSFGRREVQPALAGSTWSFANVDAGMVNGSILDVFVDPNAVQPGQHTELADTGTGRVQLAVATTDLGAGVHHYEYALVNFDFERQIRSFSLPVGAGQTVANVGFADADAIAGNDWTASTAGGHVTWTAPAGNALDWGTLYGFRFDVNAAPVTAAAVLEPLAVGSPSQLTVRTLPEPGGVAAIGAALFVIVLRARRRARAVACAAAVAIAGAAVPASGASAASRVEAGLARALDRAQADEEIAVIVALAPGALPASAARAASIHASQGRVLGALPTGSFRLKHRYAQIEGLAGWARRGAIAALAAHRDVALVYLDGTLEPVLAQGVALVGGDTAHTLGYTGAGITAAVIDSGIDASHPDLADDLVAEQCFCDDNPTPNVGCCPNGNQSQSGAGAAADIGGHGTSVAGIITSGGVVSAPGIAPDAGIAAIRVFDSVGNARFSDVDAALDWVLQHRVALGIRVVNMSIGENGQHANPSLFPCSGTTTANAVDALTSAGVAVVVASGNNGHDAGISFPACIGSAISVGGVYDADVGPSSWCTNSSCSTILCTDDPTAADGFVCHTNSGANLDLLAPDWRTDAPKNGGGTQPFAGTSAASPYAAGEAALLLQAAPSLTPAALRTLMKSHGPLVTNPGNALAFRRTDVAGALATLIDSDSDGLTNAAETGLGTDPFDADSDDDTLSDGAEVSSHGTNPLLADTDGDGYHDGFEVAAGSDPNDPGSIPPPGVPALGARHGLLLAALLAAVVRRRMR